MEYLGYERFEIFRSKILSSSPFSDTIRRNSPEKYRRKLSAAQISQRSH